MSDQLVLKFDPNTIDHLGISLYSQLPSVISELISNSWDADADNVLLHFIDNGDDKEIHYEDDGDGMTFEELNDRYLRIGRNRREETSDHETTKGRKVIGKKGLGKLSVFGICKEVTIETIKGGMKNRFSMNIDDIKASQDTEYNPQIIHHDDETEEAPGTKIWLTNIRRKSPFDPLSLSSSLSKKFTIFDQISVTVQHNDEASFEITNEMKFSGFSEEFTWPFPTDEFGDDFDFHSQINGKIFTLETPIKDSEMKGVYLTSRGKIVNVASFYGLRDTDQFHSYVTGYLEVDFIDELEEDLISTDRQSLNWEHDVTRSLRDYLQNAIKKIGGEWRNKRAEKKKEAINAEHSLDINAWQEDMPHFERDLSNRIINPILENPSLETSRSSEIISGVIDKFENQVYKEYAEKIAETSAPDDIHKLLELMDDWKAIEAKQYSDLAIARIEVIQQFEDYLDTDTKEVPTLHNFLKKFSWLLDPRILEFKDEVKYSQLLKEHYPEEVLEEQDRRIDFLCSNALGGVLYVIEIKRSKYKINLAAIDQAFAYGAFLTEKYASEEGFSKVVCYVVGGEKSSNSVFRKREKTYRTSGEVFVKTYVELLEQSKEFHKEFIQLHNEQNKEK